jgi:aminoglycoside/choline kinase family phosphotransferase
MIGRHLWRRGQLGPEFYSSDPDAGLFLIEDLGDVPLADWAGREPDWGQNAMYGRTVALMADLHTSGLEGFDPDWCFQTKRYDRDLILERETGYFLNDFIRGYVGKKIDNGNAASEFSTLADAALAGSETVLMHRDFQSRNVMIKTGWPRLIDFQGARPGPPGYDLASLLYDPYADLESRQRNTLCEYYVERRLAAQADFDEKRLLKSLPYLAACRLLQALGAFGYLTRVQQKPWFEQHIPTALKILRELLASPEFDFAPALRILVHQAAEELGVD